jgi:hypothetical protein
MPSAKAEHVIIPFRYRHEKMGCSGVLIVSNKLERLALEEEREAV